MGIFTPGTDCGHSFSGDKGGASRFFKNIKVDLFDISIYNKTMLVNLKQEYKKCGNIIENQKIVGMLNGVIKEVEKYIQNAEQFLYGKNITVKNLKNTMSTILILIRQMTELKICNVSLKETIDYFMAESEKIIKLLKEWNIEDVRLVENIKHLMIFGKELLELMEVIVKSVQQQNSEIGVVKTENITINICGNGGRNNLLSSRFFYCAKASKSERNAGCESLNTISDTQMTGRKIGSKGLIRIQKNGALGENPYAGKSAAAKNHHPTVKPLSLMEYLCTLTKTPTGGTVLDPFAGSATTGLACINTDRKYVLIEREADYCEIAVNRVRNIKSE